MAIGDSSIRRGPCSLPVMTLLVVSQIDLARGRTLLVASDSTLGCGYRWKRGPKLFTLGACCVMAFEGSTEIAYPLLINARNFVAFSDNLSRDDAEPSAIFARVQMDVSDAYAQLVQDRYFDPDDDTTCSLVLAGWSWRLGKPVVVQLTPPDPSAAAGTPWAMADIVAGADWKTHQAFFAGNGDNDPANTAMTRLKDGAFQQSRFSAYAAFLDRVQDPGETAVDGVPQVALVGPRMREVLGIRAADNRRFLLGHFVPSGAVKAVDYVDDALSMLQ